MSGLQDVDMDEDSLRELVRQWFEDMVEAFADGNEAEFGRLIGVKQPTVHNARNRARKHNVSWKMIALVSEKLGVPMRSIFEELADRADQGPRLLSHKLRSKFASGEILARAEAVARERRQSTPDVPRKRPALSAGRKTDHQD